MHSAHPLYWCFSGSSVCVCVCVCVCVYVGVCFAASDPAELLTCVIEAGVQKLQRDLLENLLGG